MQQRTAVSAHDYSSYPSVARMNIGGDMQANTCVACVAGCGVWRVEGFFSYVGIRIGGIGWYIGRSLFV